MKLVREGKDGYKMDGLPHFPTPTAQYTTRKLSTVAFFSRACSHQGSFFLLRLILDPLACRFFYIYSAFYSCYCNLLSIPIV